MILRLYMAGAALPFAESESRPCLLLDADEDDVATLESIAALHQLRNEHTSSFKCLAEAESFRRFGAVCSPLFDGVAAAAESDSRSLARSCLIEKVAVLPNAVRCPPREARSVGGKRLLYVGNFGYLPNLDAAQRLACEILPRTRERIASADLTLVGGGRKEALDQLSRLPGVQSTGAVNDLSPQYRQADVAVVPLRAGGGSRLKILEAAANAVPVVATPLAAAGLDLRNDTDLLLASSNDDLAQAAVRVLKDPELSARLVRNARRAVEERYQVEQVSRSIADWTRSALASRLRSR